MFSRETNYGSGISTASPFGASDYRRNMSGKQSYRGADQSRSAFARGLLDTSNASTFSDMEDYRRGYQQKSEQARAQDVASIRQNQLQNYALDQQKSVATKRQDTFQSQKNADLEAYLGRARKDARAATIGNVANLIMQGAFAALPTASNMGMFGKANASGAAGSAAGSGSGSVLGGFLSGVGTGFLANTAPRSMETDMGLFRGAPLLNSAGYGSGPIGRLR